MPGALARSQLNACLCRAHCKSTRCPGHHIQISLSAETRKFMSGNSSHCSADSSPCAESAFKARFSFHNVMSRRLISGSYCIVTSIVDKFKQCPVKAPAWQPFKTVLFVATLLTAGLPGDRQHKSFTLIHVPQRPSGPLLKLRKPAARSQQWLSCQS